MSFLFTAQEQFRVDNICVNALVNDCFVLLHFGIFTFSDNGIAAASVNLVNGICHTARIQRQEGHIFFLHYGVQIDPGGSEIRGIRNFA
ncbi:hypothetical protein D3C71_1971860 [compost metagenome]